MNTWIEAKKASARQKFPEAFLARMEKSVSTRPPIELYLLGDRTEIAVANANYRAVNGDYASASTRLARILRKQPRHHGALTSLSMLCSFFLDSDSIGECWEILGGRKALQKIAESVSDESYVHLKLLVELGLSVEFELARQVVDTSIMGEIRNNTIVKRRDATLFFWHIPKCGGTAFNSCLANYFYRSGLAKIPSYTTLKLFNLLLTEYASDIPYISSNHLSRWRLKMPKQEPVFQILATRNAEQRAVSAWRQYYSTSHKRLNILPQHGEVWPFWPRANLEAWARRAPRHVVNRQTSTFSKSINVEEAKQEIGGLDYRFDVKSSWNAARELASLFSLELDFDLMNTKKNVTDKSIVVSPEHLNVLGDALEPDLTLIDSLSER